MLRRTTGLPGDADYLWFSGTLGSSAPGPSTYWVDARIEMSETEASRLREQCEHGTASAPDVVAGLADQLDTDDFRECPEVARTVRAGDWKTRVWLSDSAPVLVLALLEQG